MIEISNWISTLVNDIDIDNYPKKYRTAFTLNDDCDPRTDWSRKFIAQISDEIVTVKYHPNDAEILLNQQNYTINSFQNISLPEGNVLVDATSLALPEILHIFNLLNNLKRNFDVAYIQPTNYKTHDPLELENTITYDLSDDGLGVQQLPPYVGLSSNSKILFFLGWEGHRLGALINSEEFNINNITCLLGIPGYEIGWDSTTLSCNFKQISELNNLTTPRFKMSGANDPIRTYDMIKEIYDLVQYENQSLSIAAFGTKPAAIAAAQFAVNNKNLIMLYDFVKIKRNRSQGTGLMHLWTYTYTPDIPK